MAYFNTTKETGETLKEYREKAKTQDEIIMSFFTEWDRLFKPITHKGYGASEIAKRAFGDWRKPPITSVRRSISNLVSEGKLKYTGEKRLGLYGRNERLVKLKLK